MKTYTEADFKKWGRKGGKRSLETMTQKQRSERARKAGKAKGKAVAKRKLRATK